MTIKIKPVIIVIILLWAGVFSLLFRLNNPPPPRQTPVLPVPEDRILILAPHPDDESLCCAGVIQQARKLGIPLKIVFLTYGDNNEWSFLLYRKHPVVMPRAVQSMGLLRYKEAHDAARMLGVDPSDLIFLGYPDFRTLDIWLTHWADSPAAESMLTRVRAVPYTNAFRPNAPYKGEDILSDLETIMRQFRPTKVFVSHPADHNPDHKSLYLFTQVALWDLKDEIDPEVHPYLTHMKHWPSPRAYFPKRELTPPPSFLKKMLWSTLFLDAGEVSAKREAIRMHRSQFKSAARYLLSFVRTNELFGRFPLIKLKQNESSSKPLGSRTIELTELPEQVLDEERLLFLGLEEETVSLEDGYLVYNIKLARPLARTVGVSLFVFGWRQGEPFAKMPKLHIRFGAVRYRVFDQTLPVNTKLIKVSRKPREINIRVPVNLLGRPERVLTSVHIYSLDVALDWVSWRILEISDKGLSGQELPRQGS